MTRVIVQLTARKRDRATGERWQWRHGPYRDHERAEAHAHEMRRKFARTVRVEVVPYGVPRGR